MIIVFLVVLSLFVSAPVFCVEDPLLEAHASYAKGDYSRAQNIYQKLTVNDPLEFDAYLNLTLTHKEQGNYDEAIATLKKLLAFIDKRELKILLAELYYLSGDSSQALSLFKQIENAKNDYHVQLYLGLLHEERGNIRGALRHYRRSLRIKENFICLYRLAKICYGRHDYKRAKEYFERAIALDPSVRIAYFYLGECFLKLSRYEEAYTYFSKAVNFYPKNTLIKERLTLVKKKLGDDFFRIQRAKIAARRKAVKLSRYAPATAGSSLIRVGMVTGASRIIFKCGGPFKVIASGKTMSVKENVFYVVSIKGSRISLSEQASGRILLKAASSLDIRSQDFPFYLLSVAYGGGEFWTKEVDSIVRGKLKVFVKDATLTLVNILSIEEYLYGVVPAEMYAYYPEEALKAQAVAARTLAFKHLNRHKKEGFDVCKQPHCQAYRGKTTETEATNRAVDATRGEVLVHKGRIIEPFYHANCGGCLRSDLFGSPAYLFSNVRDYRDEEVFTFSPLAVRRWFKEPVVRAFAYDAARSNFRWQRVYDAEDFHFVYGYPINELEGITPSQKGQCAHVKKIAIRRAGGQDTISGDLKLRRFLDNLKSSAFIAEIKYSRSKAERYPTFLFIWGAGFGHGLGLSQEGARAMAEIGYTYQEILHHYYKDVEIKKHKQ